MKYCSTRGGVSGVSFKDAVIMGLAEDGGLLVPESLPDLGPFLTSWRSMRFTELAEAILAHFADDIPAQDLHGLVQRAYATFDIPEVVKLQAVGDTHVLELFHGPTLAFKDVALQLLGQIFDYVLAERGEHLNILGATSGDTGSAAIAGVRGRDNIDIFILYPLGRVSALQELQMTTVADANVHCLAIEGSFDDCQNIVKTIFADLPFKHRYHLGAVNSVNWARVLAQIVYYAYASLRFDAPVNFCVPTGNFGNVFAGYLAKRLGFPIGKLIVATNENDILARFFATGEYARGDVRFTHTPAMDIQVASNFERYLYYYFGEDATRVRRFMDDFSKHGRAALDSAPSDDIVESTSVSNDDTARAIGTVFAENGYVADPHTAVGLAAARRFAGLQPMVCIATAEPAKFPEVVDAAVGREVATHPRLAALVGKPSRRSELPADVDAVKAFVSERVRA